MQKRYWKAMFVLLVLLLVFGVVTSACFAMEGIISLSPDAHLEITGPRITITLNTEEMLGLPLETFQCKHISSSGEVFEVTVTGFSLYDLLADHGVDTATISSMNFVAADDYVMAAPAEILADNPVYIMLARDGQSLGYPRSCIPNQRSMYWVKNLIRVELILDDTLTALDASGVKKVSFFREAIKELEPVTLNNRGHQVKAYSLHSYFQKFARNIPEQPVTLLALDGFEKTETAEIFLENYVTLEPEPGREGDLPLYFSEEISLGMRVKQLDLVIAQEDAVYFGLEISLPDLFRNVGMDKATSYRFVASDGFTVEIPSDAIPYGLIYPDEKGGYLRVRFDGYNFTDVTGGGKVKYLIAIEAVQ